MRCVFGWMLMILAVSAASASDTTMFNYQGRALVQGMPYTGTGRMKVAILATTGTSTIASLWSNDGSSLAGSEPAGSFSITVVNGVFDVMVGDAALGMQPLPAILFNRNDELKVRVWFNDGLHGFQKMSPDRRLITPRRMGLNDVYSSTTLYVNAATGNDLNSGLSASAAKKTIQAAVDMVPARLFADVNINVANGIYRESVLITGISAEGPCRLNLTGDLGTVPSDTVSPNVRLTGTNDDSTHVKYRSTGFYLVGCHNVAINGFSIDYFKIEGVRLEKSSVYINQCKASRNETGFFLINSEALLIDKTWSSYNSWAGYSLYHASQIYLSNSAANDNQTYGFLLRNFSALDMGNSNQVSRNSQGIGVETSYLWNQGSQYISGNSVVGIALRFHSALRNSGSFTYSSNSTNIATNSDSHSL